MSQSKSKCLLLSFAVLLTAGCSHQGDPQAQNAASNQHVGEALDLAKKNDYRNSIFELNRALQLEPKNATALLERSAAFSKLGEYESALRDAEDALRIRQNEGRAYLQKAVAEFGLKNYKTSLADLTTAESKGGQSIARDIHYNRSRCYLAQGRYNDALDEVNAALQGNGKDNTDFQLQKILCYVRMKDYAGAKTDGEQLLKNTPDDPRINAMIGSIHALSGDKSAALDHFRAAIKNQHKESFVEMVDIDPKDHLPAILLAAAYLEKSPSNTVAFISDLRSHRQLEEEEQFQLARAYIAMKEDAKAVKLLNSCLSSVPDDMSVRLELIRLYKKEGLPEKAREIQVESMAIASSATEKAALEAVMH